MENFNFIIANQMLTILKSFNDNIVSLNGKLNTRGLVVGEEDKDNDEDRMQEGSIMDITQSHMNQSCEKDKEHLEEDLQQIKDAVETIMDVERGMEEQAQST